jgi:hypothetical protein
MTEDTRNNGLHPRHPGIGAPASLIRLEGDAVEQGGFLLFLPSGATKVVAWHSPKPITPTLDAAKKYASEVVDDLLQQGGISHPDIQGVNWTSVAAAVQRIILDFNDRVTKAINTKMSRDLMLPSERRWRH